jgi:P27 family predicted phage terminase small subunit
MARRAIPITVLQERRRLHRSSAEIEARIAAEASFNFPADKVRPPSFLSDVAKKEFRRLAKPLLEAKLITNMDINALAMYAQAFSHWKEAEEKLARHGTLIKSKSWAPIINPYVYIMEKSFAQMKAMAMEFGFSPGARAKIAVPGKKLREKTPFEEDFGDL